MQTRSRVQSVLVAICAAIIVMPTTSWSARVNVLPKGLKSPSHQAHFFQGSTRSDLKQDAAPFLAQIHIGYKTYGAALGVTDPGVLELIKEFLAERPTCSAFFIKNSQNKFLVGSSRHCFSFDEEKLLFIEDVHVKDFATQSIGRPTRIVAKDRKSDFFIFEVDFGSNSKIVQSATTGLTLGYAPKLPNTPVYFYGFPSDKERDSRPTRSENCEVFDREYDPEGKKFLFNNITSDQIADQKEKASEQQASMVDGVENMALIFANMDSIRHNCNIYGGNSGGPAILKSRPDVVVGVPITFSHTLTDIPRDQYGLIESPYWIMKDHIETLHREGVSMEVISPDPL